MLARAADGTLYAAWTLYSPRWLQVATRSPAGTWTVASASTQAGCCDDAWATVGPGAVPFVAFETSAGYSYVSRPATTWATATLNAGIATPYNLRVASDSRLSWLYTSWSGTVSVLNMAIPWNGSTQHFPIANGGNGYLMLDGSNGIQVVYASPAGLTYLKP
ncbi:MAG: hypothetical protein ACK4N5_22275 [Myxococcales bacterium]